MWETPRYSSSGEDVEADSQRHSRARTLPPPSTSDFWASASQITKNRTSVQTSSDGVQAGPDDAVRIKSVVRVDVLQVPRLPEAADP